jgi:hypothetical protein
MIIRVKHEMSGFVFTTDLQKICDHRKFLMVCIRNNMKGEQTERTQTTIEKCSREIQELNSKIETMKASVIARCQKEIDDVMKITELPNIPEIASYLASPASLQLLGRVETTLTRLYALD